MHHIDPFICLTTLFHPIHVKMSTWPLEDSIVFVYVNKIAPGYHCGYGVRYITSHHYTLLIFILYHECRMFGRFEDNLILCKAVSVSKNYWPDMRWARQKAWSEP